LRPVEEQDLIGLVDAARRGDRDAFGRLFSRHAPMVHAIGLARLAPADADDLVQEVFLVALQRLDTLHDPRAFGAWLGTIARTRAIDVHRSRSRIAAGDPPETGREDPDRVEARRVLDAIRSLPEAYRETLLMRLVEEMTGPEIAERTGLTPESVRVNLHRGMKLLRERLGE
jgi:RNA polymerase sigma-70 factor (ECF subfamily)